MRIAEFAFPGPLRDALVAAVLSGRKTTTTALLEEYRVEGEALPRRGERQRVVDSDGAVVAVIETTDVRVLPLSEVGDRHAVDEGEGHADVAEWRAAHEQFWNSDELRAALGRPVTIDDATPVVAERFHVVERFV